MFARVVIDLSLGLESVLVRGSVTVAINRVHIGRVKISGRSTSSSERSNRVGLESVTAATEFTLVVLESVTGTVL